LNELCPSKTEGAGKAGRPMHPQPHVQKWKAHELVTTGSPDQSGFPRAMVLTAASWSPRRPGSFATVAPRMLTHLTRSGLKRLRRTWRQRRGVRTTRLHRTQHRRSSARRQSLTNPKDRPATTIARRRCRVHRIPPRVRDDREPPLWGRDGRDMAADLPWKEREIFCEFGLDRKLV